MNICSFYRRIFCEIEASFEQCRPTETKCPEGRKLKELDHLAPGEKRTLRIAAVAERLNRQIESKM